MLTSNADMQTRSSGRYSQRNLVCPRYNRGTEGGKSFQVSTSKLWNSLPPHIKTSEKSVESIMILTLSQYLDFLNRNS